MLLMMVDDHKLTNEVPEAVGRILAVAVNTTRCTCPNDHDPPRGALMPKSFNCTTIARLLNPCEANPFNSGIRRALNALDTV